MTFFTPLDYDPNTPRPMALIDFSARIPAMVVTAKEATVIISIWYVATHAVVFFSAVQCSRNPIQSDEHWK